MTCQRKIYLTLIISAIIIIALLLLLVSPLVGKIKSLSADLIEKKSMIFSYQERGGEYLETLRGEYTELEPKILEINSSFANPEKAIDFILTMERVAFLTNNYQEIKEVSSTKGENVLSFQISLWGSFPNLIKFLTQIENMNYFVDSNSLQITRIDEKELKGLSDKEIAVSAGDIKSIINIKTYTK